MTFSESDFVEKSGGKIAYVGNADRLFSTPSKRDHLRIEVIRMDTSFILDTSRGTDFGFVGDYIMKFGEEVFCLPKNVYENYSEEYCG